MATEFDYEAATQLVVDAVRKANEKFPLPKLEDMPDNNDSDAIIAWGASCDWAGRLAVIRPAIVAWMIAWSEAGRPKIESADLAIALNELNAGEQREILDKQIARNQRFADSFKK